MAVGIFERLSEGPDLRVEIISGRGGATGEARSVVIGAEVGRVATFAHTVDR